MGTIGQFVWDVGLKQNYSFDASSGYGQLRDSVELIQYNMGTRNIVLVAILNFHSHSANGDCSFATLTYGENICPYCGYQAAHCSWLILYITHDLLALYWICSYLQGPILEYVRA